jgi:uncharacterized protein YfaS (alpha-2-macroglobulin family)
LYLWHYPFECAEQVSSRIASIAALRDVLQAFEVKDIPSKNAIASAMQRDIKRLEGLQHYNGGFALWRPGQMIWPYPSLHVTHALWRATTKGYEVKPAVMNKAKNYARSIVSYIPSYYPVEVKWAIRAYALWLRSRMGDSDVNKARALWKESGKDKLSLEAQGWLLEVFYAGKASVEAQAVLRSLENRVSEEAGTANFVSSYSDGAHLLMHSARRADGIILEALVRHQPRHDLIVKVVRGLLAHRKQGRWGNTQENLFVLLALDAYFQAFEKVTPNFVARIWLGQEFAGEQKFQGRSTDRLRLDVPMKWLLDKHDGKTNILMSKQGKGRLYYRLAMNYAPKSLKLDPLEVGFSVRRVYEPIDKDDDVKRLPDGTWQIKAGARVRVRLEMVAPNRRYHVALVDKMPAGFEVMNPALATTGELPADTGGSKTGRDNFGGGHFGRYWWWSRTWYEHQNMRDERVEAFASMLWEGVHKYSYVARATTPGEFVAPPAKAEEMYSPEVFGRSGSDKVIIVNTK